MSDATHRLKGIIWMALAGCGASAYAAQAATSAPSATTQPQEQAMTTDASSLTAEEIGHRVLRLIDGIHDVDNISPAHLEQVFGMKVSVDPSNPNVYGYYGKLTDAWSYSFRSVPDLKSGKPTQLQLSFEDQTDKGADMTPICGLDLDGYKRILTAAGFKATPYYGEFGRLVSWDFMRGKVAVTISVRGESNAKATHSCVKYLTLEINGA